MSRIGVLSLILSAAGIVQLAISEGYKGTAYQPLPGDKQTLGFGATEGVKPGDRTTPERALARLLADASIYERAVRRCAPVPMYQYEFDTWVNFTYNVGERKFCTSTAAQKLNDLDYYGACKELLRWNRYKGKVQDGLTKRRQREFLQCIGG